MVRDKCANCGAPLRLSADGRSLECEYCESQFVLDEPSAAQEEYPARRLFDVSAVKLFDNRFTQDAFQEMCVWVNANYTVETSLRELKVLTARHTDWAMEGVNDALLAKARQQLGTALRPDEPILFFKDSGILARGKCGLLITGQGVYSYSRSRVNRVALADIYSIHLEALPLNSGQWYFNARKEVVLDNMACTAAEQGVIMALICLLVQQCHGAGFRIKAYKAVAGGD